MEMSLNSVTFCVSNDLNVPLQVKVNSLYGQKTLMKGSEKIMEPQLTQKLSNVDLYSDLVVSVQVFDSQRDRVLTLPQFSPYIPFKNARKWNFWFTLPININQLDMYSKLRFILWEYDGSVKVPFASMVTDIFKDEDNSLKRGHESIEFEIGNPGKCKILSDDKSINLLNKYLQGDIKKIKWLDDITIPLLENQIKSKHLPKNVFRFNYEFPIYELPVVYTDRSDMDVQNNIPTLLNMEPSFEAQENISRVDHNSKIFIGGKNISTLKFYDPDAYNVDPIEEKYGRMERTSKKANMDKLLKPDSKKRDYLNRIIAFPIDTKLTAHEKGSIWKYRYYLVNNKKALTKLLQSANLNEENERTEVFELMESWAELDIDDAIELLGPSYTNITVRSYAVNRLKKASDKELELYLLQLVQAVCFESTSTFYDNTNSEFTLIDLMNANIPSSSNLMISTQNKLSLSSNGADNSKHFVTSPLAEFLISRSIDNNKLGTLFYWFLKSESSDHPYLSQIVNSFINQLSAAARKELLNQIEFVSLLRACCIEIKNLKESTVKKQELLINLLTHKVRHKVKSKELKLPLDPDIQITDVDVSSSKVFKSSLSPLKINFKTTTGEDYPLMFKVGDDLRQDQLVVQIISLMNELLKNENVDLKLLPYKILATGPQEGAIQFIPNDTMGNILNKYHGILPYLKIKYPDDNEDSGVQQWVMDNFVKSCSGYCVITYLLGVGDRHLDNLLITADGRFFHADFGYILGQDPKPFPPLMKLPPQIIEAFGGTESSNYNKFRSYCFVAYSILRRNASLILNLFELMKTSNIPDIRIDPDGALLRVKERFMLELSEEEATFHFQNLINDSVSALLPIVIDHLHNFAQYWRA